MRSAVGLLCALAVLHCSSEVTSSKTEPNFHDILNKTLWGRRVGDSTAQAASPVYFANALAYTWAVPVFEAGILKCVGVVLSNQYILTTVSCFETGGDSSSEGIWGGELGDHTDMDLRTAGWRIVIVPGMDTITDYNFADLTESQQYPVGKVYVHPKYDQKCNTDFDIALLEINPGNMNGLLPDTQKNVTLMDNNYSAIFEPKTMGWGDTYAEDPRTKMGGTLYVSTALNMSSDDECREGWPEFNYGDGGAQCVCVS